MSENGKPTLAMALWAFQQDAPPVHFDSQNDHFRNRYASLGAVVEAVRPALNKHGLVVVQQPCEVLGQPGLRTTLIHAATGEKLVAEMPLVLDKLNPQGLGSAITYGRRQSLLAVLNLVADADDDANAASKVAPAAETQPLASRAAPSPQAAGATDPQRKKIAAMRDVLLKGGLIDEQTAAKLSATVEDAGLSKAKATEIIDALVRKEKEE